MTDIVQGLKQWLGEAAGASPAILITGLIMSFILFRNITPVKRATFTSIAAYCPWLVIGAVGSGVQGFLHLAWILVPGTLLLWLLLWRWFKRAWVADAAEPAV